MGKIMIRKEINLWVAIPMEMPHQTTKILCGVRNLEKLYSIFLPHIILVQYNNNISITKTDHHIYLYNEFSQLMLNFLSTQRLNWSYLVPILRLPVGSPFVPQTKEVLGIFLDFGTNASFSCCLYFFVSFYCAANGLLLLGSEVDAWAGNCDTVGPLSVRLE